jgi:hypothetical protein
MGIGATRVVSAEEIDVALEAIARRAPTMDEQNLLSVYARGLASQLVDKTLARLVAAEREQRPELAAQFTEMLERMEDDVRALL